MLPERRNAAMTRTAKWILEPVVPDKADIACAQEALEAIAGIKARSAEVVIGDQARRMHVALPAAAVGLLRNLLREMAQGHAISLVPMHAELTTQQAADALNVSRPHLVKLLETGALPFRKVGSHRRVRFDDLMRYKRGADRSRLVALRKLTDESVELGLYD
jgi:excisionase family DNA binding protein